MVGRALREALSREGAYHVLSPSRAELDLSEKKAVLTYLAVEKPDFVYHLAAKVGGIAANIRDPVGFFSENLEINYNMIHAAHLTGIRKLIYLGSSCMYPRGREVLKETDLLTGELEPTNEGYAFSKLAGMLYCKYLKSQMNIDYKVMIPCNIYGEYDDFNLTDAHLVPAVIRKLHQAKSQRQACVEIWGDGKARREFLYVGDLVAALLMALVSYESLPSLMNIGVGLDYSIEEYYHFAATVVRYQGGFTYNLDRPSGMRQKLVDTSKIQALGWAPKVSLQEGMQRVYQYAIKHNLFL